MPALSLTTMKKRRDALDAEIAAKEEKERAEEHRRKIEPAAASILGRIILASEPSDQPVVVRLRSGLANARRSDLHAWELLADTYKLDLPSALTDPIPRPARREAPETVDALPPEHDVSAPHDGEAAAQNTLEADTVAA
jgi:hypothetical protein